MALQGHLSFSSVSVHLSLALHPFTLFVHQTPFLAGYPCYVFLLSFQLSQGESVCYDNSVLGGYENNDDDDHDNDIEK